MLQKHPQLEQIFAAIEKFKKNCKLQIKCASCNNVIEVKEEKSEGILETICSCGKGKYRMRWGQSKVKK